MSSKMLKVILPGQHIVDSIIGGVLRRADLGSVERELLLCMDSSLMLAYSGSPLITVSLHIAASL